MGNLFCLPKAAKTSNQKVSKTNGFKRWLFGKGKNENKETIEVERHVRNIDGIIDQKEQEIHIPTPHDGVQSENQGIKPVHQTDCHIEPVVSSCILLKSFDVESNSDDEHELTELPESEAENTSPSNDTEVKTSEDTETSKECSFEVTEIDDHPASLELSDDKLSLLQDQVKKDLQIARIPSAEKVSTPDKKAYPNIIKVSPVQEKGIANDIAVEPQLDELAKVGNEKEPLQTEPESITCKSQAAFNTEMDSEEVTVTKYKESENSDDVITAASLTPLKQGLTEVQSCEKKCPHKYESVEQLREKLSCVQTTDMNKIKDVNIQQSNTKRESNEPRISTNVITSIPKGESQTSSDKKADICCKKEAVLLQAAKSCQAITKKSNISDPMKDLAKILEALAAIKTTVRSDTKQSVNSTGISRNLSSPQPCTSYSNDGTSYYNSRSGIQKWIKNSVLEPQVKNEDIQSVTKVKDLPRKVSEFEIPKKASRPPPKPLVLKKPSPHLFALPNVAKADLTEDTDRKWSQKDVKGPQTDSLWTTKPTAFDVKFPPLPKRLLEREGSIDKLRDSWVLPQVKQIETLKREYGRFPGLRVSKTVRDKYSVEINKLPTAGEKLVIEDELDDVDDDGTSDDNDVSNTKDERSNSSRC